GAGAGAGAAMWHRGPGIVPPVTARFQTADVYERARRLGDAQKRAFPKEAHLLLSVIGVDPAGQGQGLGRSLLDELSREADRHGVPVVTVTSEPRAATWLVRQAFDHVETASSPGVPDQFVLRRAPAIR